jgi:uncharacterized membrane protein
MPDNVVFCPGCGRRTWVPGRKETNAASNPPAARVSGTKAAGTSVVLMLGHKDNFLAALAYITIIPAIFFVLVEPFKRNRFIRFHSFQSIFFAVATIVIAIAMRILYSLFALIPRLGYLLAWLTSAVLLLGWFILWLVLLVKALQGETFKLPWIGNLAEKV